MKRLNRKEVSELVRNFGSARAWAEKYLAEWDWNEASTKFNRLYHDFREAKKAYEAEQEQQEQEESTGAVA